MENVTKIVDKLPRERRDKILWEEFQEESEYIKCIRFFLEVLTNSHVVTYKKDTFKKDHPPELHLCANIKGARLSRTQLRLLKIGEKLISRKNVSFSAYKKPVEIVSPPHFPDVK